MPAFQLDLLSHHQDGQEPVAHPRQVRPRHLHEEWLERLLSVHLGGDALQPGQAPPGQVLANVTRLKQLLSQRWPVINGLAFGAWPITLGCASVILVIVTASVVLTSHQGRRHWNSVPALAFPPTAQGPTALAGIAFPRDFFQQSTEG